MDTLLTAVGLVMLAAWAVLWVLATGALMAVEPRPVRPAPGDGRPQSFRPQPRTAFSR